MRKSKTADVIVREDNKPLESGKQGAASFQTDLNTERNVQFTRYRNPKGGLGFAAEEQCF
jgi:hypothetical protein